MPWFPCWGTTWGFPWFMLIFPVLFFGMMIYFCRQRSNGWFAGCCGRHSAAKCSAELSEMRRELDELKRKMG